MTQSRSYVLPAAVLLASLSFAAASGQTTSTAISYSPSSSSLTQDATGDLPETPWIQTAQTRSTQAAPAQTGTQPPAQETEAQRKAREKAESEAQVKKEEKQRSFGIIPAFNTVIAGRVPPLTPGEKLDLVWHTAKDPYTFTLAFLVSGLGEAEDSDAGDNWWGPSGYFKRVGTSYLDNVDGAFIGNALLPIMLHQDPRYFRQGRGPVMSRIVHAALSTIICKGDNGKTQFNVSNVAGNFIAGGVSNLYYPSGERGVGLTFDNGAVVTAEGAVGAQLLEFAPDISAYIHRRREHHRMMMQQKIDQQQGIAPASKTP